MRIVLLTVFLALIALVGDAQIGQRGVHLIGQTNIFSGVGANGVSGTGPGFQFTSGVPSNALLHDNTGAPLLNDATGAYLLNDFP